MSRTIPPPEPGQERYAARDASGRLILALLDPAAPHSPLHRALRTARLTPEDAPLHVKPIAQSIGNE